MNTKIIKLDINNKMYETITAKQGDTESRFLLFHLFDASLPFDLTEKSVRVYGIKPDGTKIFNDLVINDVKKGYCTLKLTNQMLAIVGLVKLELVIYSGNKKLSSIPFMLNVISSLNSDDAVVSTNEFTSLMNGLAALSEYDIYKSNAKQVPGIKEEVSNLSSQLVTKANKNEVGTPLIANDISEMIDTSKVYVNTTDGNWYSYNGNEWVIGGVYNSQGIGYKSIDSNKTTFLSCVTNLFNKETITDGYVYNWQANNILNKIAQSNCYIAEKIKLYKNSKYYIHGARGYFSYLISLDETRKIKSLSDTDSSYEGIIEPPEDCFLYVSFYSLISAEKQYITNTDYKTDYIAYGENKNITLYDINITNMNEDLKKIKNKMINKLVVKKDGTGDFTTIKECIDSITDSSENNKYQVYVYSGTYDMVEEFGGLQWVKSVVTTNKERQGLALPDFVDLIGIGNVHIKCEVEDENATKAFTTCVSTINIWKNNKLKNIKFTAKNTRYTCHDETNNKFNYLNRKIENCQFIHYGNKEGLWSSDKAYAGGTGSGGNYEFINCIFEAKKDSPFTFHNNENQEGNTFVLDGCKFMSHGHNYCVGFGYYKINNENNINRVFIKNSKLDNFIWVHPEVSGVQSTNVFEIHNYTDSQVKVV